MSQMIRQLDRLLEKYLTAVAPNFRLNIWESAMDLNRLGNNLDTFRYIPTPRIAIAQVTK